MDKRTGNTVSVDAVNFGLIILSGALAHVVPYQLLAFSYAVLGPAHYLTQISWLYDRKYFATNIWVGPVMGAFTCLLALPAFIGIHVPDPWFGAILLCAAASVALAFTLPRARAFAGAAITVLALVTLTLRFRGMALFVAVLLPTVIHIFVFTGAFMLHGARRSGSVMAWASVAALLACAASFWILPVLPPAASVSHGAVAAFFTPVVDELTSIGLDAGSTQSLFGFLGFAYCYHYLNWFSKVNVIRWNDVPRDRLRTMAIVYALLLATYLINFAAGFALSLLLSVLHVLLEFPLNLRTFTWLGMDLASGVGRLRAALVRAATGDSLR